ncbi:homeobox protein Hox-A1a [Lates japonicus]
MSSFLDYSVMSGEGGSCSVRAFHSDHGITTFQSCAVSVNNCGADDRFMASRASPDGIPHQSGSYQSTASSLGLAYGAHPACSSSYGPQSFCATYNHYALNQEVDSTAGFPQCGPLMYSGNISSSVVSQHRQGYGAAPPGPAAVCPRCLRRRARASNVFSWVLEPAVTSARGSPGGLLLTSV